MKALPASSNRSSSVSNTSALLWLSLVLGVIGLFLRILTLPYSFSHVLLLNIFPAFLAVFNLLSFSEVLTHYQNAPLNFLIVGITVTFLITLIVSLVQGLIQVPRNGLSALAPLGLNLVHLLLFVNLQEFVVQPDFYLHQADRAAVVQLIEGQDLLQENPRTIEVNPGKPPTHRLFKTVLPAEHQQLSTGFKNTVQPGAVEIVYGPADQLKAVFFFRSSRSTEHGPAYTAFVYKSDDTPVAYQDIFGVADLSYYLGVLQTRRLEKNWYWVDVWED